MISESGDGGGFDRACLGLHVDQLVARQDLRLTYGGNIIETGTDSCRLAQTRAQAAAANTAAV
jgi:hypothetical protein